MTRMKTLMIRITLALLILGVSPDALAADGGPGAGTFQIQTSASGADGQPQQLGFVLGTDRLGVSRFGTAATVVQTLPQNDGSIGIRVRDTGRRWAINGARQGITAPETNAVSQRFNAEPVDGRPHPVKRSLGGKTLLRSDFVYTLRARGNGEYLTVVDGLLTTTADKRAAYVFELHVVSGCDVSSVSWDQQSKRNLALGKPTRQSSTFGRGDAAGPASAGVDGDICGRGAQTQVEWGTIPYWEVDLGAVHQIEGLMLWRGAGMDGAIVATSPSVSGDALMIRSREVRHYRVSHERLTVLTPILKHGSARVYDPDATNVRYIRVFHPKKSGQINLDELVVIGAGK